MHEALFTKNHIKMLPESLRYLVNHPCNCILRHHSAPFCKHEAGTGGEEVWKSCAIQLICYEGRDNVLDYITQMTQYLPTYGKMALARFELISEGRSLR